MKYRNYEITLVPILEDDEYVPGKTYVKYYKATGTNPPNFRVLMGTDVSDPAKAINNLKVSIDELYAATAECAKVELDYEETAW